MVARAAGQLHIGTSGWNYSHWREVFYPRSVPARRWLMFYAERFTTVEVNNTFYRKPTVSMIESWQEATPPHFRFAIKMWRGITHYRQLLNTPDLLEKFMPVIAHLAPARRAPLLVQLPERMKPNGERLDRFLADLRESMDQPGFRVAVEFRNPQWLTPEIVQLLSAHGAALCLADMSYCPITLPNVGEGGVDFIYIRRHGGHGQYGGPGDYTPEEIAADARAIAADLAAGRDVYVYYNNDLGGHAVFNARSLEDSLRSATSLQA